MVKNGKKLKNPQEESEEQLLALITGLLMQYHNRVRGLYDNASLSDRQRQQSGRRKNLIQGTKLRRSCHG